MREMSERLKELHAGGVRETTFKLDFGMRRQQGHRAWRRIKNKMLKDGVLREEVSCPFDRRWLCCSPRVQGALSARCPHFAENDSR